MMKHKISKPTNFKNGEQLTSLSKEEQKNICGGGKPPRPSGPWLDSYGYPPPQ